MDIASYLPGFMAAYAILLVGALSPGPAVAMLLGIATGQGRGAAFVTTFGIAMGSVMLNLGTQLGVGLILSKAAWAMMILRFIGAAYLIWLAWGAFKKALNPPQVSALEIKKTSATKLFMMGFLLQVTNPKAIVFWLAIASLGATSGGGFPIIILFVLGGFILSFSAHAAWALLLSAKPVLRVYQAGRRWVELALGNFFCFAAFKLATSET